MHRPIIGHIDGLACPDCTIYIECGTWPDDTGRPPPDLPPETHVTDHHGTDRTSCDHCGYTGLADYHATVTYQRGPTRLPDHHQPVAYSGQRPNPADPGTITIHHDNSTTIPLDPIDPDDTTRAPGFFWGNAGDPDLLARSLLAHLLNTDPHPAICRSLAGHFARLHHHTWNYTTDALYTLLNPAAHRPLTLTELLKIRRAINNAPDGPRADLAAVNTIFDLAHPAGTNRPRTTPPTSVVIPAHQRDRIVTWTDPRHTSPEIRLHAYLDIWVNHGPSTY